jgi:pimeloyl-ACP methyl ester carboxylesterase
MSGQVMHIEPSSPDKHRDGDVVGVIRALRRVPDSITRIGQGFLLAYRMPAIRGGQTIATAMLFIPRGSVPRSGFPVVAFCHGTVGWASQWAPSLAVENANRPRMGAHWEYALTIVDLLSAGYVVVAPDYEGLGDPALGVPPTGHPYYCSQSEGRSVGFAVVATKRALGDKVTDTWAAIGHSQGGKVVIAAAETVSEINREAPELDFRGGVPIAPSTNSLAKMNQRWKSIQDASAMYDPEGALFYLGALNAYSILYVRALNTAGYAIDPDHMFGDRALHAYQQRSNIDHYSLILEMTDDAGRYIFGEVVSGDVFNRAEGYPGVRISAMNAPAFRDAMEENEIGRVTVPGKFLLVQGTADLWTPEPWCRELFNTMLANGTNVHYSTQTGADHYGVLQSPAARALAQAHLKELFAGQRET